MNRLHAVSICLIIAMLVVPLPIASSEPAEDGDALYGPIIVEEAYEEDGSVHWFSYQCVVWFWDENGELRSMMGVGTKYTCQFEYVILNIGTNSKSDVLVDSEGNVYEVGDYTFIKYDGTEYTTHGIVAKVYADTVLDLYVPRDEDEDTDALAELWRVPVAAGALAVLCVTVHRRRRRT